MMSPRPSTAPPRVMMGRGGLARMSTSKHFGKQPQAMGKVFVVAVDPSRLSRRGIKYAAWLMNDRDRDKIKLVTVARSPSEQMDCDQYIRDGQDLLKAWGVRPNSILPGRVLTIEDGDTLADTLCKAASGGHLVIGAAGKRIEGEEATKKKKTSSISAALGGTALEALGRSKAPVILVKPKATPQLDERNGLDARRAGTAGMAVVVCVDGSTIAQKSFDMAMRFVKPYACPAQTSLAPSLCLMHPIPSRWFGSNIAPVTCYLRPPFFCCTAATPSPSCMS